MLLRRIFNIVGAPVIATSAMTLFSFALSRVCRENYREPELLAEVMAGKQSPARKYLVKGWAAHYAMGVVWSAVYRLPGRYGCGPYIKVLAVPVFGTASGLVAVAAWRLMLLRSPETLRAVKPSFFLQLVPAHLVYAAVLEALKRQQPPRTGFNARSLLS